MCGSSDAGQILSRTISESYHVGPDLWGLLLVAHPPESSLCGEGQTAQSPLVWSISTQPVLGAKAGNAIVSLGEIYSPPPTPDPSQMSILSSITPHCYYTPCGLSALLPRKCSKAETHQVCCPRFPLAGRPVFRRALHSSHPQLLQRKPTVNPSPDIPWKWLISQINWMGSNIKIFLKKQ